ncbi:hypothetical protein NE237_013082 [Protea cynaroides]|uniref:Uncharacterized protein n=1 Tax=Protea cynaroides TaxID=273540 RepID=A0A9Q0JXH3_9MAGN|nr:hypothetical protein NE237_013082 [Protea cynaroides]
MCCSAPPTLVPIVTYQPFLRMNYYRCNLQRREDKEDELLSLQFEKQVRHSATPRRPNGFSVLLSPHQRSWFRPYPLLSGIEKACDGVLGLENFNSYYDPSLKPLKICSRIAETISSESARQAYQFLL